MSDKFYEIALVLTIPATDYQAAMKQAQDIEHDLQADAGVGAAVVVTYEHDNEGQRVVYLHPEEQPLEDESPCPT